MNIFYILTHGDDRKKTKSRIAYYAIKENVAARMSMYALQSTRKKKNELCKRFVDRERAI